MPGLKSTARPRRPRSKASPAASPGTALLVIDDQRLRDKAWKAFQAVRRRLAEATRELHQHEEIDVPAFEAWRHRTFPLHLTALREIEHEVSTKARRVQEAQARAARTGQSIKRIWRDERDARAAPPRDGPSSTDEETEDASRRREARIEDFYPEPMRKPARAARDIYRRLVHRLHPDHGGEWTPARQRLWHELQTAWEAGDVDWLARLEIEWETAHDLLGPRSPLSRLGAAIEELHGAQRDLEHKFVAYRRSPAWHFTQAEGNRDTLAERVEAGLGREYRALRGQLRELNAMIELWEEDWTRPRSREPRPEPAPYHEVFRRRKKTSPPPQA